MEEEEGIEDGREDVVAKAHKGLSPNNNRSARLLPCTKNCLFIRNATCDFEPSNDQMKASLFP